MYLFLKCLPSDITKQKCWLDYGISSIWLNIIQQKWSQYLFLLLGLQTCSNTCNASFGKKLFPITSNIKRAKNDMLSVQRIQIIFNLQGYCNNHDKCDLKLAVNEI